MTDTITPAADDETLDVGYATHLIEVRAPIGAISRAALAAHAERLAATLANDSLDDFNVSLYEADDFSIISKGDVDSWGIDPEDAQSEPSAFSQMLDGLVSQLFGTPKATISEGMFTFVDPAESFPNGTPHDVTTCPSCQFLIGAGSIAQMNDDEANRINVAVDAAQRELDADMFGDEDDDGLLEQNNGQLLDLVEEFVENIDHDLFKMLVLAATELSLNRVDLFDYLLAFHRSDD